MSSILSLHPLQVENTFDSKINEVTDNLTIPWKENITNFVIRQLDRGKLSIVQRIKYSAGLCMNIFLKSYVK